MNAVNTISPKPNPWHNYNLVQPEGKRDLQLDLLCTPTAQDMEFNLDNFHIENLTQDSASKCHAAVISATDYSPFGAPLPGRTYQASEYRFAFNGKEKDNETYGEGNAYDFGARIYDARLGRWLSVDPLFGETPFSSPYKSQGNCPIVYADPDGRREYVTTVIKESDGKLTMARVLVSKKVMTDGVKHQINGMNPASLLYDNEVRYYDFETTVNFVRKSDGSIEQVGLPSGPKLIKDNNNDKESDVRTRKYGDYFDLPKQGSNEIIEDKWDIQGKGGYQGGGIMFYTNEGGAMATEWKVKADAEVQMIDIENVLTAFGGLKGSSVPSIKAMLGSAEFASTLKDLKSSFKEFNKSKAFKCDNCGKTTNDTSQTQKEDGNRHQKFKKQ